MISKETIIELKNLSVGYARRSPVLSRLNLVLHKGDFFGILGPNGCGKTTILRTILEIIRPLSGEVIYSPDRESLFFGYVPQIDTIDPLFPLTVSEIVLMSRYKRAGFFRKPKKEDYAIVKDALKFCGIERLAHKLYRELSGGQQQRVLIARALAAEPDILILDEPTQNMDLPSERAILELLRKLYKEKKLTIILVSHLVGQVANYVNKVLLIEDGKYLNGDTAVVLTQENLSRLYGIKMQISEIAGEKFIYAKG